MRSSKPRTRSKSNRNRSSGGNVLNRVFDSSGPEGKVRGTPQQIIDKYNQLARDAQLANDRVATENFQQHAEHYLRLLSEAQREQDSRREEQERQNRERQAERDRDRDRERPQRQERQEREVSPRADDPSEAPQPDVLDLGETVADSGLVETPESKPKKAPARKPRARKAPAKPKDSAEQNAGAPGAPSEPQSKAQSGERAGDARDDSGEASTAAE
ncbi:DUF4167 domain-containing protein [Antarcticimicrobium luteum]|uniref:DUF4167 domain-containing protein n=1 Tax=Antarcticimicrobium luteum TaxID=2547397 RepID=A0A4R5V7H5_9RHOB|nr:DUF4167 domain-containing protein [Antarcticimicrobium luteum]TDK47476.1 DUF4167 domain-containing protein [Antarcticimicrobium luteum]